MLAWDYEDAPWLVKHLSPPMSPDAAEQLLRRIFRAFARERYRERTEDQGKKQVTRELKALRKALEGLSPRAARAMEVALGQGAEQGLGDFLPRPLHRARLVVVPDTPDLPAWQISGPLMLKLMRRAVDRAVTDLPSRRAGHPGKWSDTERKAIRLLRNVYCHTHGAPSPSYDSCAQEVRAPESLYFAIDCMEAWLGADAGGLTPENVIRFV